MCEFDSLNGFMPHRNLKDRLNPIEVVLLKRINDTFRLISTFSLRFQDHSVIALPCDFKNKRLEIN